MKQARACRARAASTSASAASKPLVPITHGTPARDAATALPCTASGAVKSTATSKPAGVDRSPTSTPDHLVPAAPSARIEHRADLALAAGDGTLMPRAASGGIDRLDGGAEALLARTDPAADRRSGASSSRASSATSSAVTARDPPSISSIGSDLRVASRSPCRAASSAPRSTRARAACGP